jgi:hypothetical protein
MVLCGTGQAQRVERIQSATRSASETKRVALGGAVIWPIAVSLREWLSLPGKNMDARAAQT